MADYGTRLKATFNNIPSGVSLFVSTRDITNDFNVGANAAQAQLVIGETAPDSPSGSGGTIGPTIIPAASQTGTFGMEGFCLIGLGWSFCGRFRIVFMAAVAHSVARWR